MIQLKVQRVGNALGVGLPKGVIRALHTAEGETLYLTQTQDGGYQLTSYDPDFERKIRQAEDIAFRYRDTFRALSE